MVFGLVLGIASFIIAVIIAFAVIDTLTSANLLTQSRESATVTNESDHTGAVVFANRTGFTVAEFNSDRTGFSITSVFNSSQYGAGNGGYNITVPLANVSLASTTGILTNGTNAEYINISISYNYLKKTEEELATDEVTQNFSEGIKVDIAPKIKTAVLIAAIVLILSILAILVAVWRQMNLAGSRGGL